MYRSLNSRFGYSIFGAAIEIFNLFCFILLHFIYKENPGKFTMTLWNLSRP